MVTIKGEEKHQKTTPVPRISSPPPRHLYLVTAEHCYAVLG